MKTFQRLLLLTALAGLAFLLFERDSVVSSISSSGKSKDAPTGISQAQSTSILDRFRSSTPVQNSVDVVTANGSLRSREPALPTQALIAASGVVITKFETRKAEIERLLDQLGQLTQSTDSRILAAEALERLFPIEVIEKLIDLYKTTTSTKLKIAIARGIISAFQFPIEKLDNDADRNLAARNYPLVSVFIESNLKQLATMPDALAGYFVGTVLPLANTEIALATLASLTPTTLKKFDDVELMNALTHIGMRQSPNQLTFLKDLFGTSSKFSADAQIRLESLITSSLSQTTVGDAWPRDTLPMITEYLKQRVDAAAATLKTDRPDNSAYSRLFTAWSVSDAQLNGKASENAPAINATSLSDAFQLSSLIATEPLIVDKFTPEQRQRMLQLIDAAIVNAPNSQSKSWLERAAQLLKK